eukprot:3223508-Prymnesium_polylepis.2
MSRHARPGGGRVGGPSSEIAHAPRAIVADLVSVTVVDVLHVFGALLAAAHGHFVPPKGRLSLEQDSDQRGYGVCMGNGEMGYGGMLLRPRGAPCPGYRGMACPPMPPQTYHAFSGAVPAVITPRR